MPATARTESNSVHSGQSGASPLVNKSSFKSPSHPHFEQTMVNNRAVAGKRSQGIGKLRPRLVLYNEGNPDAEAIGSVSEADLLSRPDGLVVVGTSLKIPGVKLGISFIIKHQPRS